MKTIIPWIVAAALAWAAFSQFSEGQKNTQELEAARQGALENEALRAEITKLSSQVDTNELVQLRKENQELSRLRNEAGLLRRQKQEAARQVQQIQKAQVNSQQIDQLQSDNQALRGQNQQFQAQHASAILVSCVNNLRVFAGAKQQWALENRKANGAIVTTNDLAPYLKNSGMLVCPAGGFYTLGLMGNDPVCSISGHILPRQ